MNVRALSLLLPVISIGLVTAAVAVPPPSPQPGEFKIFSDWAVACDNIKQCNAQGLLKADDDWNDWLSLDITRQAGPEGEAILSAAYSNDWPQGVPAAADMRLVTDAGTVIPMQRAKDDPQGWTIAFDTAIVAKLRDANRLEMRDANGKIYAWASLAGLTATLRYMDDQQGRVDTETALVARGAASAETVPAAFPIPMIRKAGDAADPSTKAAYRPGDGELRSVYLRGSCEPDHQDYDTREIEAVRLDDANTLLLVPCGAGAYNFSSAVFVARESKEDAQTQIKIEPARFDYDASINDEKGQVMVLVNAYYDPKTQTLHHAYKGRGIGDCGASASYFWQGHMFVLTEKYEMGDCRGSNNWLRTWIAQPAS